MQQEIISVDLGGTNIRIGTTANGKVDNITSLKLVDKNDLQKTLLQIAKLIESKTSAQTTGIAIGVPSVVDTRRGIVYDVTNIPSWKEVHLKSYLENKLKLPVLVNNDVNCFVLGEHRYGAAKGHGSAVGLAIGTGLGAGIIINNKLYEGSNAGAGEIGMLPYLEHDLEYYCSGNFFTQFYNINGEVLFEKVKNNNKEAISVYHIFGKHVARAIKYTLLTFDPEVIVLGGSVSKAFPFFETGMKDELTDFPFPNSVKNLQIKTAQNPNSHLLGASLLFENK
ncbi:MAG: ROK family protein [Prolixibacteraceae bacterium]|jgi:glucokinase|nr:ROK family protein [Prolixibacteraceae bacterium]